MLCSFQSANALRYLPLTFVRAEVLKVLFRATPFLIELFIY